MKKAIQFEDFVRHFTDQIFRADIDFKLSQTYYHQKFDLYNLTQNNLLIGEIDIKLFLRKYRPSFFIRLFSKKDWSNFYKISNSNKGDFQVIISMKRSSEFNNLETDIKSDEDLSGKFLVGHI